MSDYISREKALNALGEQPLNWNDSEVSIAERAMWEEHKTAIENIPSENVKPAVYGKWEHLDGDEWFCTACCHVITTEESWKKTEKKYCEECGADMRGEGRA